MENISSNLVSLPSIDNSRNFGKRYSLNNPSFVRVKGKASNRGIGNTRWATINCGNW